MAKKIKYKLGQRPKYKDGGNTKFNPKQLSNTSDIIDNSLEQGINPYLSVATSNQETRLGETGNDNALFHLNPKYYGTPFGNANIGVKALKGQLDQAKIYQRQGIIPNTDEAFYQANNGYGTIKKGNIDLEGATKIYGIDIPDEGINFKNNPIYGRKMIQSMDSLRKDDTIKSIVDKRTLKHIAPTQIETSLSPKDYSLKPKFDNGGYSQSANDNEAAWGTGLSTVGGGMMGVGAAMSATGVGAVVGIPLAAVGALASIGGGLLTGDAQSDAAKNQVDKQNAITQQNEQTTMKANLATQNTNQINFANKTPINSFYAKRGGMFKRQFANGGGLKQVASDAQIAYGATHEQGGVDAGNVEVEGGGKVGNQPGEVIKQDFVYSDSMDMSLDGKTTPAQLAQQLTLKKGNIEKQSGAAAEVIQGIRQRLTSSPSQLKSNTALREADANKTKQLKGEQQIAVIDSQLEQLKQAQIARGVQMGIYAEDGTPIDQVQQQPEARPEARRGGNLKPKYEFAGRLPYSMLPNSPLRPYRDPIVTNSEIPFRSELDLPSEITNNIPNYVPEYSNYADAKQAMQGVINSPQPIIQPAQPIDTTKLGNIIDNTPSGATPTAGGWSAQNTSTAINAGAGLVNAGVNFYNNRNLTKQYANLKNPTYVPLVAQDTGMIDYSADKNEALQNAKSYTRAAEQNSANTQGSLITKQYYANRAQDQIDKYSQAERTANVGIRDANASRQLQVNQINQQGLLASQNADFARAHSNITNIGTTNAALSSDIKDVYTNYRKDQRDQQILDLEAMKNPKSIQDAMLEQIRLQNKGALPIRKLGGKVKRNIIK